MALSEWKLVRNLISVIPNNGAEGLPLEAERGRLLLTSVPNEMVVEKLQSSSFRATVCFTIVLKTYREARHY